MDGDLTLLGGAVKTTDEGIHGPELQFLGRSLPVTTLLSRMQPLLLVVPLV